MSPLESPDERDERDGRDAWLVAWLFLLAAAVHGAQLFGLGLYWDDILHFLQAHHAARGDLLRFVASDTSGALRTERPLWFLALAAARAAYAWSVPALHAFLIALLAVGAVLVARVARRLSDDPRVALTAGVLFLAYPLAPLQPAWGATVHYQVGLILALFAMLSSERAVVRGARSLVAFLPAALAYLASLLTLELYFLLPLAWLAGLALWPAPRADRSASELALSRRAAVRGFLVLVGAGVLYALWRRFVLPAYGVEFYATPTELAPQALARRAVAAFGYDLWPWHELRLQLAGTELSIRPLVGAALAALGFGAALFAATIRGRQAPAAATALRGSGRAVARAALLVVAAVVARAVVPIDANKILGISARFSFVALPAVALLFAALFGASLAAPSLRARIARSLLAALLVAGVAAGALAHGLVKEQLVEDWRRLRTVLDGVRSQAPALADDTFVVVSGPAFGRIESHEETTTLFIALYDNPSLMANDLRRLRVQRGGVVSVTFGIRAHAFRPGAYGVFALDATERVGDLALDRLVLFRSRGSTAVAAPTLSIGRARGRVVLHHHPERILDTPAPVSSAWRHLDAVR